VCIAECEKYGTGRINVFHKKSLPMATTPTWCLKGMVLDIGHLFPFPRAYYMPRLQLWLRDCTHKCVQELRWLRGMIRGWVWTLSLWWTVVQLTGFLSQQLAGTVPVAVHQLKTFCYCTGKNEFILVLWVRILRIWTSRIRIRHYFIFYKQK